MENQRALPVRPTSQYVFESEKSGLESTVSTLVRAVSEERQSTTEGPLKFVMGLGISFNPTMGTLAMFGSNGSESEYLNAKAKISGTDIVEIGSM